MVPIFYLTYDPPTNKVSPFAFKVNACTVGLKPSIPLPKALQFVPDFLFEKNELKICPSGKFL